MCSSQVMLPLPATARSLYTARRYPAADRVRPGMVRLPGGEFSMGSEHYYREERPIHRVRVDAFWLDRTPVTNRQFREFVEATGYVTTAEQVADWPECSNTQHLLEAGSMVFFQPLHPVGLLDWNGWWRFTTGANWREPYGPGTGVHTYDDYPVVHVSYCDAEAYARWAGKELPTEAEWEFAARSGLENADYAWGDELCPGGHHMANTWQGSFPFENLMEDGYARTSPVTAFPSNSYGLYDLIGNTWEWTRDWFAPQHTTGVLRGGLSVNPRGASRQASYDPCRPDHRIARKVLKGGSYLCAPNYSRRYRPAARHAEPMDASACHIGFRCVVHDD